MLLVISYIFLNIYIYIPVYYTHYTTIVGLSMIIILIIAVYQYLFPNIPPVILDDKKQEPNSG